jgi:hypothetical protein
MFADEAYRRLADSIHKLVLFNRAVQIRNSKIAPELVNLNRGSPVKPISELRPDA